MDKFKFGILVGKILTPLIMGIIFFLLVTPFGFFLRFFSKDLLNLRYNKNKSYWIKRDATKIIMRNQF